jgi:hypothetical protein
MIDIDKVADEADMIINGYAFTKCEEGFKILNLNRPDKALVISEEGEILESTMDDIEIQIVQDYYENNIKLLEV